MAQTSNRARSRPSGSRRATGSKRSNSSGSKARSSASRSGNAAFQQATCYESKRLRLRAQDERLDSSQIQSQPAEQGQGCPEAQVGARQPRDGGKWPLDRCEGRREGKGAGARGRGGAPRSRRRGGAQQPEEAQRHPLRHWIETQPPAAEPREAAAYAQRLSPAPAWGRSNGGRQGQFEGPRLGFPGPEGGGDDLAGVFNRRAD